MCGGMQMKNILDTFRVGDDLPLESPVVTEALDKVQGQVEQYYYDIRQKVRGGGQQPQHSSTGAGRWRAC